MIYQTKQYICFSRSEPLTINILDGWSGIFSQFGLCSFIYVFVIKSNLNIFVLFYCVITFNFFFLPRYLHTKSLFVPYAYVSIESIACILLSSFEHKAIF